jgi:hypothetical protein
LAVVRAGHEGEHGDGGGSDKGFTHEFFRLGVLASAYLLFAPTIFGVEGDVRDRAINTITTGIFGYKVPPVVQAIRLLHEDIWNEPIRVLLKSTGPVFFVEANSYFSPAG